MTTQHTETIAETRRFKVFRFKQGGRDEGRFDEFAVPVGPQTTVLDALLWIQLHCDRTLALRHSCLHASCGTCGLLVNRREALACVTLVSDLRDKVTVEPLANIPILTDLVVDMDEFYRRFHTHHPIIRTSEFLPGADTPEGLAAYVRYEDCLECGLCLSACPVASTSQEYVGPAALAAAQRLSEEPRLMDEHAVLDWSAAPEGLWRCHAAYECTAACPANVNPAERIMALRRKLLLGHSRNRERS